MDVSDDPGPSTSARRKKTDSAFTNVLSQNKFAPLTNLGDNVEPTVVNTTQKKVSSTEPDIKIRKACKSLGNSLIIDHLDLTVERDSIYSLLGPSGCGKTTLLHCIMGSLPLDSGEITVAYSDKRDLGYMPQELSLFPEFTIDEIFTFYGKLFGLRHREMKERKQYLTELLNLPDGSQVIKSLSGGQARRVSFCVALIHDPKLLVLDEPTVGLDPLLADSIWQHLLRLARRGKTIIITTHYIEEAKHSDRVGLMREGSLLEEGCPKFLLQKYNCTNLEQVFLSLCKKQQTSRQSLAQISPPTNPIKVVAKTHSTYKSPFSNNQWFKYHRYKAQLMKNVSWMKRNLQLMLILLSLPSMQSYLFCSVNGRFPDNLNIALVSDEFVFPDHFKTCTTQTVFKYNTNNINCTTYCNLSCLYLQQLNTKFKIVPYLNVKDAELDAKANKVWGVIHLNENFTQGFFRRIEYGTEVDTDALEASTVNVRVDMTDYILSNYIKAQVTLCLREALKSLLDLCKIPNKFVNSPIQMNPPIYGKNDNYVNSGLPGFISSFCFLFTLTFTSSALTEEREAGIRERNKIAGSSTMEMILAHIVVELMFMCVQTFMMLTVAYSFFNNPIHGSVFMIIGLLCLVEFNGIAFAFLLTEIFDTHKMVVFAGLGGVLMLFNMGGVIWPQEGLTDLMKPWAWTTPMYLTVSSYRNIASRGYSFEHPTIYQGFLSAFVWLVIFISSAIIVHRIRKR